MTVTIHFVRHAQGFHNLSEANHSLPDPDLTPYGREQCADLRRRFPYHDRVTHLVASPLRRTLLTCLLAFEPAVARGKTVTALPEVQEVSPWPCDTGSDPAVLRAEFADAADLHLVTPGWNDKRPGSKWAPEMAKLEARARDARVWLRRLGQEAGGDADIVVVSHGGFAHIFTDDFEGMGLTKTLSTSWDNCDYRSYTFEDPSGQDPNARLRETGDSWRRRRGSAVPMTETEKQELRAICVSGIEELFRPEAGEAGESAVEG